MNNLNLIGMFIIIDKVPKKFTIINKRRNRYAE